MQNYGSPNQNSTYGGNVSGYSVVGRMSGQTSVTGTQGYNAGPGTTSSYMNSQYGSTGPPSSTGYGMNNMMPPPAQYPKGSTGPPGAAQAAAQAAVIAAASSATMRSPVYLRQHLQQKMYGGNYGNMQSQAGTQGFIAGGAMTGAAGPPTVMPESSPMPPPAASTPSAQPLSQISAMPPTSMGLGNVSNCDNASNSASVGAQGFTQTSAPSTGISCYFYI
ncbi:collagen alpha-2(I) chain-like [Centruroides sculpturatus]|uniref:collagen alpha-2(I) chain-like n=1 Tax=Centruroides sculpturatus TaxID=218467 RepID=UPI000C6D0C4A|nr:collagen alpha-2(I) chain-like [Centruroides sculpturatus]